MRKAFTLIELLVVISIIALLIAILLPALNSARRVASEVQCRSNIKQFGIAWAAYATDNDGVMVGSENAGSPGPTRFLPSGQTFDWVDNRNFTSPETNQMLFDGALSSYVDENPELYRCPAEPRDDYIRSYTINTFLNGYDWTGPSGTLGMVQTIDAIPRPTETLFMLDEPDPRGHNHGSFALTPWGSPGEYQWWDWPAPFHFDGVTHGFADGHVEFYRFQDGRTLEITSFGVSHPGSKDWEYFADICNPGINEFNP